MGRLRIKKKDAVIPFRETLAYRLLLSMASLLILLTAGIFLLRYMRSGNNVGTIVSALGLVMATTALFHNVGQARNARVPASTLKRARRR